MIVQHPDDDHDGCQMDGGVFVAAAREDEEEEAALARRDDDDDDDDDDDEEVELLDVAAVIKTVDLPPKFEWSEPKGKRTEHVCQLIKRRVGVTSTRVHRIT